MRKLSWILVLVGALALPQVAAADASVRVVHGISGTPLGLDADLPVDIWVNDAPFATDVPFLFYTDRVMLPAGEYEIEVYLAGSDPDAVAPVLELYATLEDGDNVDLVAHFDADGGIALSAFANNDAPWIRDPLSARIQTRTVRLTVRHVADFPRAAVNRLVPNLEPTLANGETFSAELDPGNYRFWLSSAGAKRPLSFQPTAVASFDAATHYYVYVVGSLADGSLQPLVMTDQLKYGLASQRRLHGAQQEDLRPGRSPGPFASWSI